MREATSSSAKVLGLDETKPGDATLDGLQKNLAQRRRAVRQALEQRFEAVPTKGLGSEMERQGCVVFPGLLEAFCKTIKDRVLSVHKPKFLGWYKQGWKASDFFHNSPGQPEVPINPSLRFIHTILSPLICGLLGSIVGSPVKMVQANVCHYSQRTNVCLENHFDGCAFSAIVHMFSTDPSTSGLHIKRNGRFEKIGTPGIGDMVLISGDKFLHRSCTVEGANERLVIVFFLEYSNPKDAKRAAEQVVGSSPAPPTAPSPKSPKRFAAAAPKKKDSLEKKKVAIVSSPPRHMGNKRAVSSRVVATEPEVVGRPQRQKLGMDPSTTHQQSLSSGREGKEQGLPSKVVIPTATKNSDKLRMIKKKMMTKKKKRQAKAGSSTGSSSSRSSSSSSNAAARRRKRRIGYVLEDQDKLDTTTQSDIKTEREQERAARRRRKQRLIHQHGSNQKQPNPAKM